MREIKFRGKRVDGKGWVDGSLVIDINGDTCIIDYADHERDSYTWHEVIPSTVGQYTGLKDKNGKEIYEGDLVQIEDIGKCEVVFSNACFFARWVDDPDANMDCIGFRMRTGRKWYSIEIIGNVFDNPELLTTPQGE